MQGAINVLSMTASSPVSLFAVEGHYERVRITDLDKSSRSDAHSLLACAVRLLILVRAYLHKGKGDRLVVLLRITRKLMNIVCRLLKSCAAMTGWWGLFLPLECRHRHVNLSLVTPHGVAPAGFWTPKRFPFLQTEVRVYCPNLAKGSKWQKWHFS